jgi:hypothetical protein
MVLLRRREDSFGWLSLCVLLALGAAGLGALPGPAVAAGTAPDVLLLVPRAGIRLAVDLRRGSGGSQVTAHRQVVEDLVENDWICIQDGDRPLSWYRVLRLGGAGPLPPGALFLDARISDPGRGGNRPVTAVALPVPPPGQDQPSTKRASRNPR